MSKNWNELKKQNKETTENICESLENISALLNNDILSNNQDLLELIKKEEK